MSKENVRGMQDDAISREQAIETFKDCAVNGVGIDGIVDALKQLPPIHPVNNSEMPNSSDVISRQAAIDALADMHCKSDEDGYVWIIRSDAWARIDALPSAQPENIRCAECKWFQCNMRQDGYLPKGVDEFECRHWCGYCDPTDFCSYAERRTE